MSPPIPNSFFTTFGVFKFIFLFLKNLLFWIFISSLPRIASNGVILEAFLADFLADKYIVKLHNITDIIIASIDVENIKVN